MTLTINLSDEKQAALTAMSASTRVIAGRIRGASTHSRVGRERCLLMRSKACPKTAPAKHDHYIYGLPKREQ
jgi:hypothetical protein